MQAVCVARTQNEQRTRLNWILLMTCPASSVRFLGTAVVRSDRTEVSNRFLASVVDTDRSLTFASGAEVGPAAATWPEPNLNQTMSTVRVGRRFPTRHTRARRGALPAGGCFLLWGPAKTLARRSMPPELVGSEALILPDPASESTSRQLLIGRRNEAAEHRPAASLETVLTHSDHAVKTGVTYGLLRFRSVLYRN